jgi:hypothetical protein
MDTPVVVLLLLLPPPLLLIVLKGVHSLIVVSTEPVANLQDTHSK